jgi:hypothetical protein
MKEAVPPERQFLQEPHGVTSQETPFFIVTAVKTPNFTGYLCLQYMNRSSERFLGFNMKDVAGKSLLETNSVDNKELMVQQLQRGREWEGLISWRRKIGDSVVLSGRVIPVCLPGR